MLYLKSSQSTIQHCYKNRDLILMLKSTNEILVLTCINFLKKESNCHDSEEYCKTSIKETIEWFPFLTIMSNTANIMENNNGLISSLLKVFYMFELRLSYKEGILDFVYLRCINCKQETGLDLKINLFLFDKITTKFVLNEILHHLGMSRLISSNK